MAEQEQDKSSQTQEPTEKRIRDAREKGDVPSSRETGNMMVVVSLIGVCSVALPWQASNMSGVLTTLIENSGLIQVGYGEAGVNKLGQVMERFGLALALTLAPVFAFLLAGAIAGVLIQGETVVALERVKPKWSKVSPVEGIKRLFSANTLVEFGKSLIKVLVVGGLAVWATLEAVLEIWESPGFLPETLPGFLVTESRRLLIWAAVFLVPVAIADILWRRYDWRRKQMMTVKEVRDEQKDLEGDPHIKARRSLLRRKRAKQRIAAAVPKASVVLTNPTRFAVALRYDHGTDDAPVCVAKGTDLVARRIREIAFENEVPIVENKPLARALFDTVEVDEAIPTDHWEMVAEIIGFVMELRKNPDRRAPKGSVLRADTE